MLLRDGGSAGPFGVMGGFIQAQAHVQLVSALVDDGLDPQAALDRPRFRVEGAQVRLEEGLWERRRRDRARSGYEVVRDEDRVRFGGGQAILVEGDALVGGSDAPQGRLRGRVLTHSRPLSPSIALANLAHAARHEPPFVLHHPTDKMAWLGEAPHE